MPPDEFFNSVLFLIGAVFLGIGCQDIGGSGLDHVAVNASDLCPEDPQKTEPGECGCGVPEGSCSKGTDLPSRDEPFFDDLMARETGDDPQPGDCKKSDGCYEIVPSGTSDDTALIQAALDNLSRGDTLRLKGDFVYQSSITPTAISVWARRRTARSPSTIRTIKPRRMLIEATAPTMSMWSASIVPRHRRASPPRHTATLNDCLVGEILIS